MSKATKSDTEQFGRDYYLPGTPSPSVTPGPVEKFLTCLFRRRGRF
ncbi:MAG: hypothetical protein ABEJ73_01055 [Haloplanus sp.]